MIPQKIHYCWFGRNPKPKLAEKCIKSWKKYCPDYEIVEWNEDNFDLNSAPLYVRQAYEAKKWAFVTDYVRLKVVYDHGGIYMDTDVELLKNLDFLLDYDAYFGFEDGEMVNTGMGFGAIQKCHILQDMMEEYENILFISPDGNADTQACPQRNTAALLKRGLKPNNTRQILDGNILILPSVYMSPISYYDGIKRYTKDTISVHWFSASWQTPEQRQRYEKAMRKIRTADRVHWITRLPNRVVCSFLGRERYESLKRKVKW